MAENRLLLVDDDVSICEMMKDIAEMVKGQSRQNERIGGRTTREFEFESC